MASLVPIVILLVMICLWITFRLAGGIVVPIAVVLFTVIFTLALQVIFDAPVDVITSALPVFLVSIGVADGIHIFSEFRDSRIKGFGVPEAVKETLTKLALPVILTSVTTAAAFWSLAITEVVQIKNFGIFVAAGTMIAMVLSLIFIPALLLLLPETKSKKKKTRSVADQKLQNILTGINKWVVANSGKILITAVIMAALGIYGASKIRVDNNGPAYFKPHTNLVKGVNFMNSNLGGSDVFNLLILIPKEKGSMKDPRSLKLIDDLERFLHTDSKFVGKTFSLAGLVKRMNYVMHENDHSYDRIPGEIEYIDEGEERVKVLGRELISQYILLYENGGGDNLSDVVSPDFQEANVRITVRSNSSHDVGIIMDKIREYKKNNFPDYYELKFAGLSSINVASNREIIRGQMTSLGLSLALVLLLLMALFRSSIKGVLGVVPLLFSIIVNFGTMGYFNIYLDIGSAIISSIAIGVGVDYSIHYISRLQIELDRGLSYTEAMMETVKHSGKAIAFNAIVVGTGFLALMFSQFVPINTIGWMVTMTMIISCVSTLVLIPALLNVFRPKFFMINERDSGEVNLISGEPVLNSN